MIDLHTHVLPEMDDGAGSLEESLAMLAESVRQGVTLCAATPHCQIHKQEHLEAFLARRDKQAASLRAAAVGKPAPELILGAEVYMDNDISAYTGIDRLCIQGTPYLLVEFPVVGRSPRASDWLHTLILQGIRPLIAHIDRYPDWEAMLEEFNGLNLHYQVNAARARRFMERRILKKLLVRQKGCIMSSDMHNTTSRPCNMKAAYEWAAHHLPEEAEDLFENNARRLLSDE